jgi:hypothetical protein
MAFVGKSPDVQMAAGSEVCIRPGVAYDAYGERGERQAGRFAHLSGERGHLIALPLRLSPSPNHSRN